MVDDSEDMFEDNQLFNIQKTMKIEKMLKKIDDIE